MRRRSSPRGQAGEAAPAAPPIISPAMAPAAKPNGRPAALSLTVVLPAFNEEENVPVMIDKALAVLPDLVEAWEIIVVDDGSTDRTAAAAEPYVDEHHPRVRLFRHTTNQGYGAAIRTGFVRATSDLVFYTDSDNQFDLAELEWFLPLVSYSDVVVGFRVYRYDTVLRSIVSWVYNRLVNVLFAVKVRDVDCAFKLFRREVIDKIPIESRDFFVDTELVAKARKWNFRIVEKGVRHYPRVAGETTVQPSDIGRTLRTIVRMWQHIYVPSRSHLEAVAALHRTLDDATVEVVPSPSIR